MSVGEESGDDVMLSDASPASPGHELGSPIVTALINVGGDGDVFARFVRFPSKGVVDLAERPPQAERSRDHQVRLQRCVHSQGPFRSPLPYNLKTGLLIWSSVAEGKRREEYSDEGEKCQGHSTQRLSVCRPLPKCLLVQLETTGRSSWST